LAFQVENLDETITSLNAQRVKITDGPTTYQLQCDGDGNRWQPRVIVPLPNLPDAGDVAGWEP